MRRYALRDDQWDRIKDILPGREGHVGGTAPDNRLFVEAVLFRFRAGAPWRDLPERFGCWKIVYQRFNRWAKSGVFERVFRLLASDHDNEYMMIDALFVDYAGDGVPVVIDRVTSEIRMAQIFVARLGASSFTFAHCEIKRFAGMPQAVAVIGARNRRISPNRLFSKA
jgi:transposase